MNKLLISEISIDLHLQSFTHLAQQNLEGKKKEGEEVYPASNPFLSVVGQGCAHRRRPPSFTPGWRQEVPGGGWGENKFSFLCSSKYINDRSISGASPSSSAI